MKSPISPNDSTDDKKSPNGQSARNEKIHQPQFNFCAICRKPIHQPQEQRTVQLEEQSFIAHGSCLVNLRRLLCNFFEAQPPIPTLTRPLTLAEFLLTKRPQTDAEILACIAFHLQTQNNRLVVSPSQVKEQLVFTGFKIQKIAEAFRHATEDLAYFELDVQNDQRFYRLTEKGVHVVQHLPTVCD